MTQSGTFSIKYRGSQSGDLIMTEAVIEWAPFRMKPGVDETALLRSSEELQMQFLAKQRGFIRRELLRGGDGNYVDLVWWDSMDAAQAAMKAAAESPACNAYFSLMSLNESDPSAGVLHFWSVQTY
jgi:hypothetical protein